MSEKYIDEMVLELRIKHRQLLCKYDLEQDDIYIGHRLIHFNKQTLAQLFKMTVPDQFQPLSEADIRKRFTSERKPQIVLADGQHDAVLTFSAFASEKDLSDEIDQLKEALEKLFPANVFYERGIAQSASGAVHWCEYKSFSADGASYNLQFLFVLPSEQRVLGKFECDFPEYDSWRPCVLKMIETISPIEGDNHARNEH